MRRLFIFFGAVVVGCLAILVGAFLAYEFLLFWVSGWSPDFNAMDRCADNGGRWVYESRECEGEREGERMEPPTSK